MGGEQESFLLLSKKDLKPPKMVFSNFLIKFDFYIPLSHSDIKKKMMVQIKVWKQKLSNTTQISIFKSVFGMAKITVFLTGKVLTKVVYVVCYQGSQNQDNLLKINQPCFLSTLVCNLVHIQLE